MGQHILAFFVANRFTCNHNNRNSTEKNTRCTHTNIHKNTKSYLGLSSLTTLSQYKASREVISVV